MDEGYSSSPQKTGSARTSKKSRKRNVIRYTEWSVGQESFDTSPPEAQQHAQDVKDGDGASPGLAGETMTPEISTSASEFTAFLDHQGRDASPNSCATVPGFLPPPDDQDEDIFPLELHVPATSEHTEDIFEFQRIQEEQKADDWRSENMRVNAQNLRYGGYPAQPAPQNRNTPLGSGRLQNTTKLGTAEFLPLRVLQ